MITFFYHSRIIFGNLIVFHVILGRQSWSVIKKERFFFKFKFKIRFTKSLHNLSYSFNVIFCSKIMFVSHRFVLCHHNCHFHPFFNFDHTHFILVPDTLESRRGKDRLILFIIKLKINMKHPVSICCKSV